MSLLLYIGTYSKRGSQGIYAAHVNPDTGALSPPAPVGYPDDLADPSWLAVRGSRLYAVSRTRDGASPSGRLAAFRRLPDGRLRLDAALPCGDGAPCHAILFDQGRRAAVSHYKNGRLFIARLEPDGRPAAIEAAFHTDGHGPVADRQEGPHLHSAMESPDGTMLFAADLGLDCIFQYDIRPHGLVARPPLQCPPGSGPRHMAMAADGATLWAVGELDSTLIVFRRRDDGFHLAAHLSLLPAAFSGVSSAADLRLHPNGRWLYATNRGADDVTILAVGADGIPAPIGWTATPPWPRGMILSPDGRFLYTASEHGDRLDAFAVDPETGLLDPRGRWDGIPSPVAFAFASETGRPD